MHIVKCDTKALLMLVLSCICCLLILRTSTKKKQKTSHGFISMPRGTSQSLFIEISAIDGAVVRQTNIYLNQPQNKHIEKTLLFLLHALERVHAKMCSREKEVGKERETEREIYGANVSEGEHEPKRKEQTKANSTCTVCV